MAENTDEQMQEVTRQVNRIHEKLAVSGETSQDSSQDIELFIFSFVSFVKLTQNNIQSYIPLVLTHCCSPELQMRRKDGKWRVR